MGFNSGFKGLIPAFVTWTLCLRLADTVFNYTSTTNQRGCLRLANACTDILRAETQRRIFFLFESLAQTGEWRRRKKEAVQFVPYFF